ncbi:MAG TPA: sensor domain-containing diguanylate cyclase [Anaeromyxobacteraceae bacterium]|nr:sensor domain-containing diguanylate cyclase [Anaeromyxobacteraceae bacterium]
MDQVDLLRELRRAVEGLRAFEEVGRSLTSTLEPSEVLAIILEKVGDILRPSAWALLLADDAGAALEIHVAVGFEAGRLEAGGRVRPGEGIAGWVAGHGQAVLVDDVRADARFSERVDPAPGQGVRSYMAAPLRGPSGTLGVIALAGRAEEPFAADDLRTLSGLAAYAAIALSNARHFERVRELTLVDDHTGLYNARQLHRALDAEVLRAARFGRSLSVIFFDLDRFKAVNDAHGHQAGSALLREVGAILKRALRGMDVPVRYGGDEFVAILPETSRASGRAVAERVRAALRDATFLADRGLAVRVSASFGVASFPEDGATGDDLLRAADRAMYRAKDLGRDRVSAAGDAEG